jgi:hypothetical protein
MGECLLLTPSAESHPANRSDFFNTHSRYHSLTRATDWFPGKKANKKRTLALSPGYIVTSTINS